jgi:hypothetical protein
MGGTEMTETDSMRRRSTPPNFVGFLLGFLLGFLILLTAAGCGGDNNSGAGEASADSSPPPAAPVRPVFRDVTRPSGIRFVHVHGGTGKKFMPETMGSGLCFLDYDVDGNWDLYFVNSGPMPGFSGPGRMGDALYRNLGNGRFEDVSAAAGLGSEAYGQGCAVGDIDNDGDPDLYVTNFGPNQMYRNNGDGTFTDVTDGAGVGDPLWGVSTTFLDYDADGFLDLYVTNYVAFELKDPTPDVPGPPRNIYCGQHREGYRAYCSPKNFPGQADVLYRNRGDGTFENVTRAAGVFNPIGKGLGVVTSDYDSDGDVDMYVANDLTPNFLYRNNGDGTFEDATFFAGTGFGEEGKPQAGMGTDFGDFDGDLSPDLVVCNLSEDNNSLYRNLGDGTFEDLSFASGIGLESVLFVGFGADFFDFDNDADLDLFITNGHIIDNIELYSDNIRFAMEDFLYENKGGGDFRRVTQERAPCFNEMTVGRGMVSGDFDNDGDLDLVVSMNNREARVYENLIDQGNHWITIRAEGTRSNRDGLGAVIRLTAGGRRQREDVRGASSYCSQNDRRIHFGLGRAATVERIEILWPSGQREYWQDLQADQFLHLVEGTGTGVDD